jgi:hypothetical protein
MDAGQDFGVETEFHRRPASNTVVKALPTARRATKRRSSSNNGSRENAGEGLLSLFDAHRLAMKTRHRRILFPADPPRGTAAKGMAKE